MGEAESRPFSSDGPGENPFAEFEAPHRSKRASIALALWGSISICLFLAATIGVGVGDFSREHEWSIGVAFGFGFGIVSLAALWAVLGPFRLFTRVPLAILLTMLAAIALAAFYYLAQGFGPGEGRLLVAAAAGVQWLGLVALLSVARAIFRFKVAIPGTRRPAGNQAAQFGIRQLLLWTTGVALILGIARLVLARFFPQGLNWRFLAREGTAFALLLGFNLLVACPIVWSVLSQKMLGLKLLIACVALVIVTVTEIWTFHRVLGPGPEVAIFCWINGAGASCLGVNLFIVRLCGYRLVPDVR